MSSRWAEDEADKLARKKEKEEKARKKQKKLEEEAAALRRKQDEEAALQAQEAQHDNDKDDRPAKRRRVQQDEIPSIEAPKPFYRFPTPTWSPARSVTTYERLNHIEEGSYGFVSRARDTLSGTIVALKKLKPDTHHEGFPTTSLREIQCLRAASHPHIVSLLDIVVSSDTDASVYLVMEFVEHDLKTLQGLMEIPFLPSEIKTIML